MNDAEAYRCCLAGDEAGLRELMERYGNPRRSTSTATSTTSTSPRT
ncbi:MAG: hypothetical protein V8R40_02970 [Dysosmobacter sp.]